jgi:hypothetical protein
MSFWELFAWMFIGVVLGVSIWVPVIVLMWRDIKWKESRDGTDETP